MSNKQFNGRKGKNRGKGGPRKNNQRNNFQDKFSDSEYDKGYEAGKDSNGRKKTYSVEVPNGSKNDASWYIPDGQMAKDVLSLPESIASGRPIVEHELGGAIAIQKVPGIMAFNVMTVLPQDNDDDQSPINRAGLNLYQAMQAANSRTPQYGMPILMLYLLAMGDLIALYQHVCRAYGVARNYDFMNLYTPEALLTAMEIQPDSVRGNLANVRTEINQLANGIQSLLIPSAFAYLEKKSFLFSNIYKDSDTAKAQYYLYRPVGFLKWTEGQGKDPAGNPGLTYLNFIDIVNEYGKVGAGYTGKLIDIHDLITLGWEMLSALRNSDDVKNIGADLLRAFGVGAMYKINPIAEQFITTPVYEKEILSQMENAFIYPDRSTSNKTVMSIIQEPGIKGTNIDAEYLYMYDFRYVPNDSSAWQAGFADPNVETNPPIYYLQSFIEPDKYLLNFHESAVSSELLLTSSRFTTAKPLLDANVNEGSAIYYTIHPETTEIILGVSIYTMGYPVSLGTRGKVSLQQYSVSTYSALRVGNNPIAGDLAVRTFELAALWSTFDWAPRLKCFAYSVSGDNSVQLLSLSEYGVWDIDNYYELPKELLTNVNYMATVGLFTPKGLPGTT